MSAEHTTADFRRPWWLINGHLETIYANTSRRLRRQFHVDYQRELLDLPDGDSIALDYLLPDPERAVAPSRIVIIFHGLEGCSRSLSVMRLARYFSETAIVAVPNYRCCGGVNGNLARFYHAADGDFVHWIIDRVRQRWRAPPRVLAIGISLGGVLLTRQLVEEKQLPIDAAVSISAPLNLGDCARHIDKHLIARTLYRRGFLRTMRQKVARKKEAFPEQLQRINIRDLGSFDDFDNHVTATLHGFTDAAHYWRSASSHDLLHRVQTPLMIIQAKNDPLLKGNRWRLPRENANVRFISSHHGGHAGFIGSPRDWLAEEIERFYRETLIKTT